MKRENIVAAALEAGIMISTQYGQNINKAMPVSDYATLEKFARFILNQEKEEKRDKGIESI